MKTIKVVGRGCIDCAETLEAICRVVHDNKLLVSIEKATEDVEIEKLRINTTPGIFVDDELVSEGVIPKNNEILNWLR